MIKSQNKPLVSVCMMTYNHEKYISQALESVLIQKVNFDYEIVVAEDCSTDNSRKILLEYYEKYPDLFRLILQKTNVGSVRNYCDVLTACSGKYIAYLETDDFWTDECKLQKQVDFLENNPEYGMVHTRANIVDENNDLLLKSKNNQPSEDVFDHLIFKSSFIINCTICFRKSLIYSFLEKIKKNNINYVIDYYLWVHIALFSKIHFLFDVTSAYRSHSEGISKKNNKLQRRSMPYILTDIIGERFLISKEKKIKFCKRFKYGILYSRALLSREMKIADKVKRSLFYIKQFYLIPTILISFILKLYLVLKRIIQHKIVF